MLLKLLKSYCVSSAAVTADSGDGMKMPQRDRVMRIFLSWTIPSAEDDCLHPRTYQGFIPSYQKTNLMLHLQLMSLCDSSMVTV